MSKHEEIFQKKREEMYFKSLFLIKTRERAKELENQEKGEIENKEQPKPIEEYDLFGNKIN